MNTLTALLQKLKHSQFFEGFQQWKVLIYHENVHSKILFYFFFKMLAWKELIK